MMEELVRDSLFALRRLRRTKTFSVVVIGILAAAMTANATVLSVLYALILRPLPVPVPGQVVAVSRVNRTGQVRWMSAALFKDISGSQRVFSAAAGYAGGVLLTIESERVLLPATVEFVTDQYYSTLAIGASVGRLIGEQDKPLSASPARVVVLAHAFWQRHFSGDSAVIGRTLRVAGVPLTIIGVTRKGFAGLQVEVAPSVTVPIGLLPALAGLPASDGLPDINHVVGRLRPGVSLAQAEAQLTGVWEVLRAAAGAYPSARSQFDNMRLRVERLDRGFSSSRGRYTYPLFVLAGITVLLLALTCFNLAALFLTRIADRRNTYEILVALGAGRARIARPIILEALPLVLVSALVAIPCARLLSNAVANNMWGGLVPLTLPLAPDVWLVPGILTVIIASSLLSGVVASRLIRTRSAPREHSASHRYSWWTRPLVVAQVAISLVLVFAALLLAKSAARLSSVDSGVDGTRVLVAKLAARPGSGAEPTNPATYLPDLLGTLRALPQVESVGLSYLFPFVTNEAALMRPVAVRGRSGEAGATTLVDVVSPEFFATVGIPLIAGRTFAWSDDAASPPVAVLNRIAVSQLFGDGPALGEKLALGKGPRRESVEIVGVVADTTMGNLRSRAVPVIFRPSLQEPAYVAEPALTVRTSSRPLAAAPAIREAVASSGHHYVLEARSLDARIAASMARERVMAALSSLFAIIAIAVAISGLYGLLAHAISRRTREIGVRMALGATRDAILRQVILEALTLCLLGLAFGAPAAFAVGGLIEGLLFGVSGRDLIALGATAVFFLLAGGLAGALPGRRASRVEPVAAILRAE